MYFNSSWTDWDQFLVRNEGAPPAPHPAGVPGTTTPPPPVPSIISEGEEKMRS